MTGLLWKVVAGILLVILLASGGYNIYQAYERHSLTKQVTDLTDKNKNLSNDLSDCKNNINKQNNDVDKAKATAADKQKQIDDLNKTLADQRTKDKAIITKLSSQQAPKTCAEAQEYLKKNLELYQW